MITKAIKGFEIAGFAIAAVGLVIDTGVNLFEAVFGDDNSDNTKKIEEKRG